MPPVNFLDIPLPPMKNKNDPRRYLRRIHVLLSLLLLPAFVFAQTQQKRVLWSPPFMFEGIGFYFGETSPTTPIGITLLRASLEPYSAGVPFTATVVSGDAVLGTSASSGSQTRARTVKLLTDIDGEVTFFGSFDGPSVVLLTEGANSISLVFSGPVAKNVAIASNQSSPNASDRTSENAGHSANDADRNDYSRRLSEALRIEGTFNLESILPEISESKVGTAEWFLEMSVNLLRTAVKAREAQDLAKAQLRATRVLQYIAAVEERAKDNPLLLAAAAQMRAAVAYHFSGNSNDANVHLRRAATVNPAPASKAQTR